MNKREQDKIEKWIKWIEILHDEAISVHANKYIFLEVQKIISENPNIQKPSHFFQYYSNNYSISVLMGIRRILFPNSDGVSFHQLLLDINENYKLISRDYYKSLYGKKLDRLDEDIANSDFDTFSGNTKELKNYIDKNLIESDLRKIDELGSKVKSFIDKRVAHFDDKPPDTINIPTFADMDNCVEFIGELLKRYMLILKSIGLDNLTPIFQYDWKAIFTEKWI